MITVKPYYDKKEDVRKIVSASVNTANYFYQTKGFIVSSKLIPGYTKLVYMPEQLPFYHDPKFRELIAKCGNDSDKPEIIDYLVGNFNLDRLEYITDSEFDDFAQKVNSLAPLLAELLYGVFPKDIIDKIQLNVIPVRYGTYSSFSRELVVDKHMFDARIRIDVDPRYLIEGVISNLVGVTFANSHWQKNWRSKEMLVDFLVSQTRLKDFFPEYEETLEIIDSDNDIEELYLNSTQFLKKLGYYLKKDAIGISGETIFVNNREPLYPFSKSEKNLLKHLMSNKGLVCSFEEIAAVLWGDDILEKYSIWSLSKHVQRLREKLKANGVEIELIQTVRGQGYIYLA